MENKKVDIFMALGAFALACSGILTQQVMTAHEPKDPREPWTPDAAFEHALKQLTNQIRKWWEDYKLDFDKYTPNFVLKPSSRPDPPKTQLSFSRPNPKAPGCWAL